MSVSKQITAMAAALLITDGKLKISGDIRRYLPELPEVDPAITVADLIHHTSGLQSWDAVAALHCRVHGRCLTAASAARDR